MVCIPTFRLLQRCAWLPVELSSHNHGCQVEFPVEAQVTVRQRCAGEFRRIRVERFESGDFAHQMLCWKVHSAFIIVSSGMRQTTDLVSALQQKSRRTVFMFMAQCFGGEFAFRTTIGKEKQLDCVMGKEAGDVVVMDAESRDAKRTSVISLVNNAYSC